MEKKNITAPAFLKENESIMNIISGIARGISLEVPKGLDVRPTAVRARKSLFDSLRVFQGLTIVDLFSGIGALGLEAASRGASDVYFVENSFENCRVIEKNIQKLKRAGVEAKMNVVRCDAMKVCDRLSELRGKIDIIFADPPYDMAETITKDLFVSERFVEWAGNALFIFESPSETSRKPDFKDLSLWSIKECRKLGQSVFYFLIKPPTK